jgi:riboflavin kinase/FMN adenylyltransferase
MQVHRVLPTEKILDNIALTVGSFDGVHKGHQSLVAQLKAEAQLRGLKSAALTFDDLPYCFFRPDACPKLLSLADEKIEHFAQTGLDHLFIIPFTSEIASTDCADFMRLLAEHIGLKLFMGGPDFALGKNRDGTIPQLQELGKAFGFEAKALDVKLPENGAPISSTRCRGVIEGGQIELARQFLNRTYKLAGNVISGDKIGRKIGVPTINLQVAPRKCLPKNGVYAVYAHFDGQVLPAALNMGFRPTVGGLKHQIEFHVLDRNIETPPESVEIEYIARLRDEQKFDDIDALVAQMKRDLATARDIL